MAGEQMTQEEVDSLLEKLKSGEEVEVNTQSLGGSISKNEARRVKTALERLQFAQENGMNMEEIRYRSWYLKDAAQDLWLKRHGLTRKEWREKVWGHFKLHPEHYQLLLLKRSGMYKY